MRRSTLIFLLFSMATVAYTQDRPYRIGGGVSAPAVLSKQEPEYSEEARKAKVQASVVTNLVINEEGVPSKIRVIRGAGFGLDERAIETIGTWRFKPGTKEGKPVPVMSTIEVHFRILDAARADQSARLNFTLQAGASRPELRSGKIPENASNSGNQTIRIHLEVNAEGKPENVTVVKSTDKNWEARVLREVQSWRFQPSMLNGTPVAAPAVFDLSHGPEDPPDRPAYPSQVTQSAGLELPAPVLASTGTKPLQNGATQYNFAITNYTQYPDRVFEVAPDLPPCGRNANAARTWVDIYRDNGERIYGFCALKTAAELQQLWFPVLAGTAPPASIRVVLTDRRTNRSVEGTLQVSH